MQKFIVLSVLSFLYASFAGAELNFPTTTDEIVQALPKPAQTWLPACPPALPDCEIKGLESKGIAEIAEDAPKVGAIIHFASGSAQISQDSHALLGEYVKALNTDLQDAVLLISGHTDNEGNEEYNQRLSLERAKAVRQFLVQQGVTGNRLRCVGFGKIQPLRGTLTDQTKEEQQANRRVEFVRTD